MTFSATLTYPALFGKMVQVLKELVEIVTFDVTQDGMGSVVLDSAHVFLIELQLNRRTSFTAFKLSNNCSITLKIADLNKIFKNVSEDDKVTIIKDGKHDAVIVVRKVAASGGERISTYKICQLSIEEDRVAVPDKVYACGMRPAGKILEINISLEALVPMRLITQEIKGIGDQMLLTMTPNEIEFFVKDEFMEARAAIQDNKMPGFGIMCSKILNQTFNSKYFIKMGKVAAMTQAQECMLQMGEDLPLSMVFQINGMGTVQFFLAPMLEDEE